MMTFRTVFVLLGFQICWWSCVLSARSGMAWLGLLIAILFFGASLLVSPVRSTEIWFVPLAASIGYAVDSFAISLGALQMNSSAVNSVVAPIWIAGLWLAFASTLSHCFSWLRGRLLVAAGLGALCGPASYAAGNALGVTTLSGPWFGAFVLGVLWAITLPVQIALLMKYVPLIPVEQEHRVGETGRTP